MSEFADAGAGTAGLIFFFATFAVIALWAYLPANKAKLEAHKRIPLDEETQNNPAFVEKGERT